MSDGGGFKLKRREDRWLMPDEAAALRAELAALRERVKALEAVAGAARALIAEARERGPNFGDYSLSFEVIDALNKTLTALK